MGSGFTNGYWARADSVGSGRQETTTAGWTGLTGGGQPHENRPPYYALCYIMKM